RRRHTRFSRDWSSDMCSSDLLQNNGQNALRSWKQPLSNGRRTLRLPHPASSPHQKLLDPEEQRLSMTRGRRAALASVKGDASLRSEERRVGKECRARGRGGGG